MANSEDPLDGAPKDYLVTIDVLESLSGLDFFSALPDSVEFELEAAKATSWGEWDGENQ